MKQLILLVILHEMSLPYYRALVTHWRSGRATPAPVQMTDKAAVAKIRTAAADHTHALVLRGFLPVGSSSLLPAGACDMCAVSMRDDARVRAC